MVASWAGLWLTACAPRVQPFGMEQAAPEILPDAQSVRMADGRILPLRMWEAEGKSTRGVILALHGFNDYSNAFDVPPPPLDGRVEKDRQPPGFGPYLAAQGYTVYAYDQRGFGAGPLQGIWAGTEALKADVVTMVDLLHDRHPEAPLYLAGESMGGAVVLTTLADNPDLPVTAALLFAPAVWGREAMPFLYPLALDLTAHLFPSWTATGDGLDIRATNNDAVALGFGTDPLFIKQTRFDAMYGITNLMDEAMAAPMRVRVPLLYLYGLKDEVIPRKATLRAAPNLPDLGVTQRLAVYEDGYHLLFRDLQGLSVLEDVRAWLADPAAPLPSGADGDALGRLRASRR